MPTRRPTERLDKLSNLAAESTGLNLVAKNVWLVMLLVHIEHRLWIYFRKGCEFKKRCMESNGGLIISFGVSKQMPAFIRDINCTKSRLEDLALEGIKNRFDMRTSASLHFIGTTKDNYNHFLIDEIINSSITIFLFLIQ